MDKWKNEKRLIIERNCLVVKVLIARIKNVINQVRYYRKKYGIKKTIKKILSKTYAKIFRKQQIAKLQNEREK